MKLFITGITGHSGGFFIKKLQDENCNYHLKCVVRKTSDTAMLDESNLDIIKSVGDLNDVDFIAKEMTGYDIILHIASIYQSANIMKAARLANVKNAVLVHTTGMFSRFKSASEEYIDIENKVLEYRDLMNITILRPTMIYGSSKDRNMFKLIDYLNCHKFFPIFGNGKNLVQPVHAQDLGDAYYNVIKYWDKTKNKEYNLSGKYPIEYIKLVKTVENYLGKKVYNVRVPIWISLIAAVIYNKISKRAIISVEQVQRMMEDKTFSYYEAENDFGYRPRTFSSGIKKEVDEYLKYKNEN